MSIKKEWTDSVVCNKTLLFKKILKLIDLKQPLIHLQDFVYVLPSSPVQTSSLVEVRTLGCLDDVSLWEVWIEMSRLDRLASVLLHASLHLPSRPGL